MRVSQQVRVLKEAKPRISEATATVEPGRWYFAGRPL
jgi:hypothetical protein